MPKRLKKFITLSIVFHIIAVYVVWFSPIAKNDLNKRDYKVTWIKLSKGDGGTNKTASLKNTKALPQSTIREQKLALKEQSTDKKGSDLRSHKSETKKQVKQLPSQKKTSNKGGINLNKKSKKRPKTKSIMANALARIDQELKQREVEMTVAQAKSEDTGQSPFGTDKGSEIVPALISYYNKLKRKINNEWVLAKGEFAGPLVAKIVVMINSNGAILKSHFKKSSGDGSFDASAMRALKRSAPFPIPPTSIRSEALSEGFLIEFNPKKVTGRI